MRLVTWNIQAGKGCDGVIDLARIVAVARALADADVFCFQEVSDGFERVGGAGDQGARLAELLPDYRAVYGAAVETVDQTGRWRRFGNITLSRLPIRQVARHLLPWPRTGEKRSMRRLALDVTVQASFGPVRIVNTHLEFHSAAQREAQIARLLDLQQEASEASLAGGSDHGEPYASQIAAASSILCGDFNFDVTDPQHRQLHGAARPGLNYRDAWRLCHPDLRHPFTCGIHDHAQWPHGPDCRDFVFVTEDLAGRVCRIEVDGVTAASDHQPVLVELAD
jgi:endonuclease/exonuclease/phosphatase family metal-dependent hydrolase